MRFVCRRLRLSLLIVAGLWPAGILPAAAPSEGRRPNILLLIADDLGWVDVATGATNLNHGNTYAQTPAIDRLAAEGMGFTAMRVSPNCAPTRAALFTGQGAAGNSVYNVGNLARGKGSLTPPHQADDHIPNEAITLAETLRAAGYATGHVAKYHISSHPDVTRHDGFDVNYGGGVDGDSGSKGYFAVEDPASPTGWTFRALGPEMHPFAAPYTREYVEQHLQPCANGNDPASLVGTPKHLTDATADAAIDFMTRHAAGAGKDKPFFLNVAFNAVHTTINPRPDLLAKYQEIPSADSRHTRPDVAAEIEGMDQAIARILKHLDGHDLVGDTLVVFVSDNGGSGASTHNNPLRGYKGMFYEGGIRVPLIARLPGVIRAGSITHAMASALDLYPTFADFAGARLPDPADHPLEGVSLAPVLRGTTDASVRSATYYHFPGYLGTRAFPCSVIVKRVGDGAEYKLLYYYEDRHYELYNLTDDLREKTDLLKDGTPTDAARAVAADLRADLHRHLAATRPLFPTDPATGEAVPLPVPLEQAMSAGNQITRTPSAAAGEGRE